MVNNPGFENGSPLGGGTLDFTGWTPSPTVPPSNNSTYVVSSADILPHGGTYEAKSGPSVLESISQSIATTAGHIYEVSFWLAEYVSYNSQQNQAYNTATFQSSFAGQTLTNITTVITAQTQSVPYTKYTADIVATGASSTLQFSFKDPPAYWLLDDVSVTDVTPEASSLVVWSVLGLVGATVGVSRRQRSMSVA